MDDRNPDPPPVPPTLSDATSDQLRQSAIDNPDFDLAPSSPGTFLPPAALPPPPEPRPADRAADRYDRRHLHATGGIGRVWLVRDPKLGRDVALKEIRPERTASPAVWARFVKEAQVTGQLEHPGIVPIYELGKAADGQPFYTMRFVRGRTLAEAVAAYHDRLRRREAETVELRELLGDFVAVCNAVAYAHSRGVIHRDLKPQNVVVGEFGEVIVLDWGLAKVLGEADGAAAAPVAIDDRGSDSQTVAGQVMGTPAYMAPEQAEGHIDRLDARTDVYGLGGILYEILTGRTPFAAPTTLELLRRVKHDPPTPPRAVMAGTPPALQAVCLKALAKHQADRYGSAKELADDVRRWLADEPVAAFPDPPAVRAGRWARRHKSVVAAAAALLLTVAAASTLGVVLVSRKNVEVEAARRREEEQRLLAQANFRKARDAVDKMLTRVGNDRLRHVPAMETLRRELLEEALAFNQDFLNADRDDPELRHEAALAHGRLGQIYHRLRRDAAADEAERQAIGGLERLAEEFPTNPAYRRDLAGSYERRSGLAIPPAEIDRASRQALDLRRQLAADPGDAGDQLALADALLLRVNVTRTAGQRPAAEEAAREALPLYRRLAAAAPGRREIRFGLARTLHFLAILIEETGRTALALEPYTEALDLFTALAAESPENVDHREALASVQRGLAIHHARGGNPAAAKLFDASVAGYERLAREFPFSPDFQERLAVGYGDLGVIRARAGNLKEAEPFFRKAVERQAKLAADFPHVTQYQRDLGFGHLALAQVQLDTDRNDAAVATLRESLAIRQRLADAHPAVPDYRWDLSVAQAMFGRALNQLGRTAEAEKQFRAAVATGKQVVAESDLPAHRHKLTLNRSLLAGFLRDVGRGPEAEREFLDAIAAWEKLTAEVPKVDDYRRQLALALWALGGMHLKAGRLADAGRHAERAVAVGEALLKQSPAHRVGRRELAESYRLLARVHAREAAGADQAMTALRQAVRWGYRDAAGLAADSDFAGLRGREDFKRLLAEMPKGKPD